MRFQIEFRPVRNGMVYLSWMREKGKWFLVEAEVFLDES